MTRTEQAYVRRLDKRRKNLLTALQVIHTWLLCPWCATSAQDMCSRIAKLVVQHIEEEEIAKKKEETK